MFRLQSTKLFPTGFSLLPHLLFIGSTGGSSLAFSRQNTALDGCCSPSGYGFKSRFLPESNGQVKTMVQEHQQSWWVDVESITGPYSFSSWNAHWILSAHSKTPDWYVSTYSPRPFKQRNAWVARRRIIIPITIIYYNHTNNCLWSIAIACAYLHTMIALFVDAPLNTALATSCWRVALQQLPPVRWSHRCGTRQLQQAHFRSARVPRSLDFQCMSLLDAKSWVVDHGKAKWNDKENCIRETYKQFKIILVITYVWYVPCKSILCIWRLSWFQIDRTLKGRPNGDSYCKLKDSAN